MIKNKRVAFYIQNEWAFGRIHNDLIKHLHYHGIDGYILDWAKSYTSEEIRELDSVTDLWHTTPQGYLTLKNTFGINSKKVSVVTHSIADVQSFVSNFGSHHMCEVYSYGAISKYLRNVGTEMGITRKPVICIPGITVNLFTNTIPTNIRTIGFAGTYTERPIDNDVSWKNIKRGWLAREIAEKTGCEFKIAQNYHNSFVTMQGFYSSVDCVIQTSLHEGGGLPLLEAGCAGKLILTTPVGFYPEHITTKGGIELPYEEHILVEKAVNTVNYYNERPEELIAICKDIQKHSEWYDWKYTIREWLKLF